MQGEWWKTTEISWALVCYYKKTSKRPIELTNIATKLLNPPTNLMRGMLCYETPTWSKKRWRKVYQKIPQHTRLLLEKRLSDGVKDRKTTFKPFLIRRTQRS